MRRRRLVALASRCAADRCGIPRDDAPARSAATRAADQRPLPPTPPHRRRAVETSAWSGTTGSSPWSTGRQSTHHRRPVAAPARRAQRDEREANLSSALPGAVHAARATVTGAALVAVDEPERWRSQRRGPRLRVDRLHSHQPRGTLHSGLPARRQGSRRAPGRRLPVQQAAHPRRLRPPHQRTLSARRPETRSHIDEPPPTAAAGPAAVRYAKTLPRRAPECGNPAPGSSGFACRPTTVAARHPDRVSRLTGDNQTRQLARGVRGSRRAGYACELDVQLTRSGELVVVHDYDLTALTGAAIATVELTRPIGSGSGCRAPTSGCPRCRRGSTGSPKGCPADRAAADARPQLRSRRRSAATDRRLPGAVRGRILRPDARGGAAGRGAKLPPHRRVPVGRICGLLRTPGH